MDYCNSNVQLSYLQMIIKYEIMHVQNVNKDAVNLQILSKLIQTLTEVLVLS